MKVINTSNQKIVANKVKVANNTISRFIGLLNRSNLNEGEGLQIIPCNSIHSFFMRFNFDAIFLDKSNKVKFLMKNMTPCKVSPLVFTAHSVLELPAETIERFEINIDDALEFYE
ncbi:MAG: DUF192 domain-containing protein [Candidatus Gastranaerophilales bacterium]|nr:DUF192 domain-containing protein [Candidatus Gastranaerophilales bacterium]